MDLKVIKKNLQENLKFSPARSQVGPHPADKKPDVFVAKLALGPNRGVHEIQKITPKAPGSPPQAFWVRDAGLYSRRARLCRERRTDRRPSRTGGGKTYEVKFSEAAQ